MMRKPLRFTSALSLAVLALSVVLSALTLPATDNFNRSDSGTLGSNWTDQVSGLGIVSNHAESTSSGYAFHNVDTYDNDQYSQAVLGTTGTTNIQYAGVSVRASGTGGSYNLYMLYCGNVDCYIGRFVSGSFTLLQTISGESLSGATYKITVVGTTLKAYKNGTQIGSDQATGGDLASGSAGLYGNANAVIDDWEGGNVGGGGATPCLRALLGVGCDAGGSR